MHLLTTNSVLLQVQIVFPFIIRNDCEFQVIITGTDHKFHVIITGTDHKFQVLLYLTQTSAVCTIFDQSLTEVGAVMEKLRKACVLY